MEDIYRGGECAGRLLIQSGQRWPHRMIFELKKPEVSRKGKEGTRVENIRPARLAIF